MKILALTLPGYGTIDPPGNLPSGGSSTLSGIISTAFTIFIVFGILVALFAAIYAGFNWIFSQGDKQKVAKARDTLLFVVIGLTVIFLSFVIIELVGYFFGVNLLNWSWFPMGGGGIGPKRI